MSNVYGFQEVEPEFLNVMPLTARIYQYKSSDKYGKLTWDTAVTAEVPMHAEMKAEEIRRPDGSTAHVDGKLFLGYIVPWLSSRDRLDLPDMAEASGWKTTIIGAVVPRMGPDGVHHQEVYFGQVGATTRGMGA